MPAIDSTDRVTSSAEIEGESDQDAYESAHEFLSKMDSGSLDGRLFDEAQKLTLEQAIEVAQLLAQTLTARA